MVPDTVPEMASALEVVVPLETGADRVMVKVSDDPTVTMVVESELAALDAEDEPVTASADEEVVPMDSEETEGEGML